MAAVLVFFMQPGFAMLEAGLTRAKNAGNMKNFMDFALATLAFWLAGFGLMFGHDLSGLIGVPDFFAQQVDFTAGTPYPDLAFLLFQTVLCAVTTAIVSGAMAERTKFSSYCLVTIIISLIIYPVAGHWVWGGGWLGALGFHDFAGASVVSLIGGICARRQWRPDPVLNRGTDPAQGGSYLLYHQYRSRCRDDGGYGDDVDPLWQA